MKELWAVLIEKLKQVEADAVALGLGIVALLGGLMGTIIIVRFIKAIVQIVMVFAPHAQ